MSNWRRKTDGTLKYSTFSGFLVFPLEGTHHRNKENKKKEKDGVGGKERKYQDKAPSLMNYVQCSGQ